MFILVPAAYYYSIAVYIISHQCVSHGFVVMIILSFICRLHQNVCHGSVAVNALRWRHNDHAGVSSHQPHGRLLNRLFRRKSKKTLKLRVTGLCAGNSPGTGEFPAQMASYAENVSIWWRHHESDFYYGDVIDDLSWHISPSNSRQSLC